jgi:hypothetical protein
MGGGGGRSVEVQCWSGFAGGRVVASGMRELREALEISTSCRQEDSF